MCVYSVFDPLFIYLRFWRYYFEKDEHCFELRKNNFTTDYAD